MPCCNRETCSTIYGASQLVGPQLGPDAPLGEGKDGQPLESFLEGIDELLVIDNMYLDGGLARRGMKQLE